MSAPPTSYDPNAEVIFSAEQIVVPPGLTALAQAWVKEVMRVNPPSIVAFSAT